MSLGMNGLYGYKPPDFLSQLTSMQRQSPMPPQGEDSWLNYLGIGAGAITPIAAALLSRQRQGGAQLPGGSVSLGSKPMMGVPNPYPQNQQIPQFLARLLMGGR